MRTTEILGSGAEYGGGAPRARGSDMLLAASMPSLDVRRPRCTIEDGGGGACPSVRALCGDRGRPCVSGGGEIEGAQEKEDTHTTTTQAKRHDRHEVHEHDKPKHSTGNSTRTEPKTQPASPQSMGQDSINDKNSIELKPKTQNEQKRVTFSENITPSPPAYVRQARTRQAYLRNSITLHERVASELAELVKRVDQHRQSHLDTIAQCDDAQTDCIMQAWALQHEADTRGCRPAGTARAKAEIAATQQRVCRAHQKLTSLDRTRRRLAEATEKARTTLLHLQGQRLQTEGVLRLHEQGSNEAESGDEGQGLMHASLNPNAILENAAIKFNDAAPGTPCEPGVLQIQFDIDDDEAAHELCVAKPTDDTEEVTSETTEGGEPFYSLHNTTSTDRRYQSMTAEFGFQDSDGQVVRHNGVCDSGAAQCALRRGFLEEQLPGIAKSMQPTSKRFLDAQGQAMDIAGTVELTILIGECRMSCTAYVFNRLGADFLLGANAIYENNLVIHARQHCLYKADLQTGKGIGRGLLAAKCIRTRSNAKLTHQSDLSQILLARGETGKQNR